MRGWGIRVLALLARRYSTAMNWVDYFICSTFIFFGAAGALKVLNNAWVATDHLTWQVVLISILLSLAVCGQSAVMFVATKRRIICLRRSQWWAIPVLVSFSAAVVLMAFGTGSFLVRGALFLGPPVLLSVGKGRQTAATRP